MTKNYRVKQWKQSSKGHQIKRLAFENDKAEDNNIILVNHSL